MEGCGHQVVIKVLFVQEERPDRVLAITQFITVTSPSDIPRGQGESSIAYRRKGLELEEYLL